MLPQLLQTTFQPQRLNVALAPGYLLLLFGGCSFFSVVFSTTVAGSNSDDNEDVDTASIPLPSTTCILVFQTVWPTIRTDRCQLSGCSEEHWQCCGQQCKGFSNLTPCFKYYDSQRESHLRFLESRSTTWLSPNCSPSCSSPKYA